MKIIFFQILIIFISLIIISSNSKTNKESNKNIAENKSKTKDLDVSENFNAEIYYKLGTYKNKYFVINQKLF